MSAKRPLWGNLAGPPVRRSPATPLGGGNAFDGLVKLRLCHGLGRTYLLPDVLIGFRGTRFFLPSFFGPPWLTFGVPKSATDARTRIHSASFTMDVTSPRGSTAARLEVTFHSDERVRTYDDGAQLYRCRYAGPARIPLSSLVSGACSATDEGDYALRLYHHTAAETVGMISASAELWSGPANLAGTRDLANVAHTYFTTLPEIRDDGDLRRIAMSAEGRLFYQTTSVRNAEDVLALDVYRSTTGQRAATVTCDVPCGVVAPAHLLFHPMVVGEPAYYEVVGPEIVRVAVAPGARLPFVAGKVSVGPSDLKRFDYVVEGNASTAAGLEAPMREDETDQVAHLERLDGSVDLFEYWRTHANTDLTTGRAFERRGLAPVP